MAAQDYRLRLQSQPHPGSPGAFMAGSGGGGGGGGGGVSQEDFIRGLHCLPPGALLSAGGAESTVDPPPVSAAGALSAPGGVQPGPGEIEASKRAISAAAERLGVRMVGVLAQAAGVWAVGEHIPR